VQEMEVLQGQTQTIKVRPFILPGVPTYNPGYRLRNAASPIQLQIASSAPNVATAYTPAFILVSPGGDFPAFTFTSQAQATGTTMFSLKVISGSASAAWPVTVKVLVKGLSLSASTVGYNLMGPLYLSILGKTDNNPVQVQLAVSDPGLCLLSADDKTPGQPSLSVSNVGIVFIQSLANSGSVDITASADGYATAKISVTM